MEDIGVPDGLISFIRKRSSRSEKTRFPYKLFSLLGWAGKEPQRWENAGCGWVSDTEFFIDKKKICELMNVKLNTLNVNLKTLGFEKSQTRKDNRTFYKNEGFSYLDTTVRFESIRNSRCKSESLRNLNLSAVYMPCLEPLKLFMMTEQEINQFKHDVIEKWSGIVELNLVFAIPLNEFIKFLKSNVDDRAFGDILLVQQALAPRVPDVWDILDFAIFLARFGPFCNIQSKLYQYQDLINDIQFGFITYSTPSSNYFSDTFHNCFRFHLPQIGEYHCYNLPLVYDNTPFLADEDGVVYPSWRKMLQQNQFLSQGGLTT